MKVKLFENHLGAARVLTHGYAGLEISAMLSDLGPGDEVILRSPLLYSFSMRGATPVFCEVDPDTMLIDLDDAS